MNHYWYRATRARKTMQRCTILAMILVQLIAIVRPAYASLSTEQNETTPAAVQSLPNVDQGYALNGTNPASDPLQQTPQQDAVTDAPDASSEWMQDGHDAQRTGYTSIEPSEAWNLAWTWNGSDSSGGAGKHFYNAPQDARTVTGGSFVYVPAGDSGLYGLRKRDGVQVWRVTSSAFNATPAYDPATGFLFAGGANGTLYKINAGTGAVTATYNAGSGLNKSILVVGGYVYAAANNGQLHKVSTGTMAPAWVYSAGSGVATPPAYSDSRKVIVYATDDLYVHAVRDADGSAAWKVKPTSHTPDATYTFRGYWPVIAERHGIVLLRMNLGIDALWSGPNTGPWGGGVYPTNNSATRSLLTANNGGLENLFALNLDSGAKQFIPAVGFGGVEDLDANGIPILQVGPVPVIKSFSDGSEVAYIPFRSGQGSPNDGRWDSHMGEMVLDDTTIAGLAAGDMRFIDFPNSYIQITDEQTPLTMAGDTLFHAHWGASDSFRITNRSASLGITYDTPITAQAHPPVIRRQTSCGDFNASSHYTTSGLNLYKDGRYWNGPGWWTYWNVMDPPTRDRSSYSEGLLPRYTYVSGNLIVVEGNGGELMVFTHSGTVPAIASISSLPTPGPASAAVAQMATPVPQTGKNLAIGKAVMASSQENSAFSPSKAIDNDAATYWSSSLSDPQWIQVDLGSPYSVSKVLLHWEAYARAYKIQVSNDAAAWKDIYSTTNGQGGTEALNVSGVGRYVRMYGTQRVSTDGYSLYELEIYGEPASLPAAGNNSNPTGSKLFLPAVHMSPMSALNPTCLQNLALQKTAADSDVAVKITLLP